MLALVFLVFGAGPCSLDELLGLQPKDRAHSAREDMEESCQTHLNSLVRSGLRGDEYLILNVHAKKEAAMVRLFAEEIASSFS